MLKKILAACALACCGVAIEAQAVEQDIPSIYPIDESEEITQEIVINEESERKLAPDAFVCDDPENRCWSEDQWEPSLALLPTDLADLELEEEATLLACEDCR